MRPADLTLARLSSAVYEDWPVFEGRAAELGFATAAVFDHAGTQAALVSREDSAVIVFRGTEASRAVVIDLVANLGVPVRWAGEGRVHSGYVRAFNRISYEVRTMAEQVSSEVPLFLTGHSMGGALAELYAAWTSHNLAGVITFGTPKTMSRRAALAIRCEIRRIVMPFDFAQCWPPIPILGHPGPKIRLVPVTWYPGPVTRHDINGYVRSLEATAEGSS